MSTNEDFSVYHSIDPPLSDDGDEPVVGLTKHSAEGRSQTPSDRSSVASSDHTDDVYATTTISTTRTKTTLVVEQTEQSAEARTEHSTELVTVTQQTVKQSEEIEQINNEKALTYDSHSPVDGSLLKCWPSRVSVTGSGLVGGVLGQELTYHVDARNGGPGELTAFCMGPNRPAYCEMTDNGNGTFTLNAKPEETGEHVLQVKYEGEAVPGSPFTFPVTANGTPDDVTKVNGSPLLCWPSRVSVSGSGLLGGVLGQELTYTVDTRNGGPGELTAFCMGPNRPAYCEMTDNGNGTFTLNAKPEETGEHVLQVKYEGEAVPGSPFTFPVTANGTADDVTKVNGSPLRCWPSRVSVTGSGLAGGVLGQELTYNVDARNGGPGELTAFCMGPNRPAYCEMTDNGNGTFTLSARPEETGEHVLQVKYEGEAVPGSPFRFQVTANGTTDDVRKVKGSPLRCWPSRVSVTGSGLAGGVLGQELTCQVDARNGGPGVLTAYCTGPKRLAYCQLIDHGNGTFTLRTKPEETGHHVLQVKYQGEPVSGSPFTFPVTASPRPDATRVKVSGPGVENGILSTFHSDFAVDTKGAGAGNLSIRMQGPKGAFRMEMSRMSHGDRKVFCHYNPISSGVYLIVVRWSNIDVPGSPFQVKIFDNSDEMERDQIRQN